MDFSNVLKMLKIGCRATRRKWEDPKAIVTLDGDKFWKSQNMQTGHYKRTRLPYSFTKDDILANDWELER